MVSVIIPVKAGGSPQIALGTLGHQTFKNFETIVLYDEVGNANWARNRGAEIARGDMLLFSDDDVVWEQRGIEWLVSALVAHPECAYSFGSYMFEGQRKYHRQFDVNTLRRNNYISTMSLIRADTFPGFDESILRLQDWDLWLTLAEREQYGVFCGETVFHTARRNGLTFGNRISYEDAERTIRAKHNL